MSAALTAQTNDVERDKRNFVAVGFAMRKSEGKTIQLESAKHQHALSKQLLGFLRKRRNFDRLLVGYIVGDNLQA
jgi:hypothetical protein